MTENLIRTSDRMVTENKENLAYIIDAKRTPVGKRNGSLKGIHPVHLLSGVLKTMVKENGIEPSRIEDVVAGCVTQRGEQAMNIARNAWLSSGFPETVPGVSLDRQCGSSLQAALFASSTIMSGLNDLVIACGVESMSRIPMGSNITPDSFPADDSLIKRYDLTNGWFDQAHGAEMIAKKWNLQREALDQFSFRSHELASRFSENYKRELIPVNGSADGHSEIVLDHDEGVRPNPSLEKMASLPPAFPGLELITAGNASQISDGASAAILASKSILDELNLKAKARFISFAAVGVDPITMLTGPIPATRKVLSKAGMSLEDIDIFEVNEAFAPVVLAWEKELKVDPEKVNVSGGAIAIGHPLGATGTRIVSTMVNNLERTKSRYGLIAICEGGGMANAAIVERIED